MSGRGRVGVRAHGKAFSIYARPLFAIDNDADSCASVAAMPIAELDIVRLGLDSERKFVDKIVKWLKFLI